VCCIVLYCAVQSIGSKLNAAGMNPSTEKYLLTHRFGTVTLPYLLNYLPPFLRNVSVTANGIQELSGDLLFAEMIDVKAFKNLKKNVKNVKNVTKI